MDRKTFKRVMSLARQIKDREEDIHELLDDQDPDEAMIWPSSFCYHTQDIPLIAVQFGGELKIQDDIYSDCFDAILTVEGINFVTSFIPMTEKERYLEVQRKLEELATS